MSYEVVEVPQEVGYFSVELFSRKGTVPESKLQMVTFFSILIPLILVNLILMAASVETPMGRTKKDK